MAAITYTRFRGRFGIATVRTDVAPLVREILDRMTLYEFAAAQPGARVFSGRGPVYGIPLGEAQAVVRRSRHGGALAGLMGDVFIGRTRAHYELSVSLQLRAVGVRTPEVIGYVRYDAGPFLRRADVITREVTPAISLATALGETRGRRDAAPTTAQPNTAAWAAVTDLVQALGQAGAYHRDLNVRNVLLTEREGGNGQFDAHVLDVDRIVWSVPGNPAVAQANIRRLQRSARKLGLL